MATPSTSLQDRFASLVDAKLRDAIVQKNGFVWNNKYEGNPKAGAVKIPIRDTEAAVVNYGRDGATDNTVGAGAALGYTVGTFLTVTIDKDKAINEKVDGYTAEAVPDNIIADRLDSAGYSLALQMNVDGTAELLNAPKFSATSVLTSSNIYAKFVELRTALSKEKVPNTGRFALVSPEVFGLLLNAEEFIKASALGDAVVQSGAVGQVAGFLVFEDTSLPEVVSIIVGHSNWCTRVEEWAVPPRIQSLDGSGKYIGEVAIQGRKIYAHKLTKPQTARQVVTILDPTFSLNALAGTFTLTKNTGNTSAGTYTQQYKRTFYKGSDTTPTAAQSDADFETWAATPNIKKGTPGAGNYSGYLEYKTVWTDGTVTYESAVTKIDGLKYSV